MEINNLLTAEQARAISLPVSETLKNILERVRSEAEEGKFTCPYNSEALTSMIKHTLFKLGYDIRETENCFWIDWTPDPEDERDE